MRRSIWLTFVLALLWGIPLFGQSTLLKNLKNPPRFLEAPPAPVMTLQTQTPVIGPGDAIGFDYTDADYVNYMVDRFEASYDSAAFATVPAAAFQDVNGVSSYRFTPTPTSGTHNVVVRACNPAGCGVGSSPFAFAVLGSSPGAAPFNLRKVPRQ